MTDAPGKFDLRLDNAAVGARWSLMDEIWLVTDMELKVSAHVIHRCDGPGEIIRKLASLKLEFEARPMFDLDPAVTLDGREALLHLDGQAWRIANFESRIPYSWYLELHRSPDDDRP